MPDLSDIRPSLSRRIAQQVADVAGTTAYGGQVEGSTNVAFGGPTADFILYGVVNGAFSQGPPNANDYIDPQNNPMPYWSGPTQVSGGAIQATWVTDSSSPSGHNLRFILNPGAAGDEAYVEQIVPIGGNRFRALSHTVRASVEPIAVSGSGLKVTAVLQYLNASFSNTGSSNSTSVTIGGAGGVGLLRGDSATASPPADAAYLSIQLHVLRNSLAATDSAILDISDVRMDHGVPRLTLPEIGSPATYTFGYIQQINGVIDIVPNGTGPGPVIGGLYVNYPGAIIESGIISATIAADQNNYSPSGLSTCAWLQTTVTGATRTITGFDATGFTEGQEFSIVNDNTNQLTFAHASASSTSGNRIGCPGAVSKTISTNGSATFVYLPSMFSAVPFRMVSAL